MKSKFFRILGVATAVALLVSMLTVAPAMALTAPQVTLVTGQDVISLANADYQINFNTGVALGAGDSITVTFPADTTITPASIIAANCTIAASPGWVGGTWQNAVLATLTWLGDATARTVKVTLGAGDQIGSTASVIITITAGITNPSTAGSYQLSVKTSQETTAVPSAAYTIVIPTLAFPGIVKIYNPAGIWMNQFTGTQPITDAIAAYAVGAAGYTIELGPGTYTEPGVLGTLNLTDVAGEYDGLIIKASGALADTIVYGNWVLDADSVTFKGITLKNNAGTTVITVNANADKLTVDGCTFTKKGTASTAVSEEFISYDNNITGSTATVTGCTFDSSLGAVKDIAVDDNGVGLTVKNCTFTLDNTEPINPGYLLILTTYDDWAIDAGIAATITGNTFTGTAGGSAIAAASTVSKFTISGNTFKTVDFALYTTGATTSVDFAGNTLDTCGMPIVATYNTGGTPAILISTSQLQFLATNNKISGTKAFIAWVSDACAPVTHFNYNNLSGNTLGFANSTELVGGTPANKIDATHNFWGAATGPTSYQALYPKGCDTSGYLGAAATNGTIVLGGSALAAKSTVSVEFASYDAVGLAKNVASIGAANFSASPVVAVPSTLTAKKFFDVFALGAAGVTTTVEIKFYGTITAGANAEVWFYTPDVGAWTKCNSQVFNSAGGVVTVTVTNNTVPALIDLLGTPFVLVEAPPPAPGGTTITAITPAMGASNVAINTTFSWPAVPGAVSYEWQLAADTGQTTDKFYLKDDVQGPTVNAVKPTENLKYSTTYWWRVRAKDAAGKLGDWTTAFFTTEPAPAPIPEPTPPVVIEQTPPPEITLTVPPAEVTKVEPIPAYLLWAVIAVGAVLVIAVIVLIVRTRRIS